MHFPAGHRAPTSPLRGALLMRDAMPVTRPQISGVSLRFRRIPTGFAHQPSLTRVPVLVPIRRHLLAGLHGRRFARHFRVPAASWPCSAAVMHVASACRAESYRARTRPNRPSEPSSCLECFGNQRPSSERQRPRGAVRRRSAWDLVLAGVAVGGYEQLGGAMNVISKADAPLARVQPLRQGGIFIGQEGDRCGAGQRRTDAAHRHSARDRTTCACETTAAPRRRDWCATR
jgi:hypothetical protein